MSLVPVRACEYRRLRATLGLALDTTIARNGGVAFAERKAHCHYVAPPVFGVVMGCEPDVFNAALLLDPHHGAAVGRPTQANAPRAGDRPAETSGRGAAGE